jgi:hypothetical protein
MTPGASPAPTADRACRQRRRRAGAGVAGDASSVIDDSGAKEDLATTFLEAAVVGLFLTG